MKALFGVFLVVVTMLGAACSTAPLSPPTTDVTGEWTGSWQYQSAQAGGGDMRGTFKQEGNTITGNFHVTGPALNRVANLAGTISGNEIVLSMPSTGRLTVTGNEISGLINGLDVAKVSMKKKM